MLLGNKEIARLADDGAISGAKAENIGPVSYDLTTNAFHVESSAQDAVSLEPGDSVFVSSAECLHLPDNVAARVGLKNSRIREGLSLDAPLYFPGHETRVFFRVTNVSANRITLDKSKGIAQVMFELVDGVTKPYSGAFSDEFSYKGLGEYSNVYEGEIEELSKQADELKTTEKRVYSNTLALMAVFAAIFTLVNVNAGFANMGVVGAASANLMVLGGFSTLAGIIGALVGDDSARKHSVPVLVVGLALVAASVFVAVV